jgi:hypothetical protein
MPRWPRLQILVRVPAGKNLPAFVFVWHKDDPDAPQVAERVELDKEGRGIMQSHPPGHRRISLRGPYGPPVEAEFTVDPDRPQPVDVLLDPE